jgi:hypothetical protein
MVVEVFTILHQAPQNDGIRKSGKRITSALGARGAGGEGGGVDNAAPLPLHPQGIKPVPIVQEAGWALWPVWMGAENLTPTGIRSPNRPARSKSLCRLNYPSPRFSFIISKCTGWVYTNAYSFFTLCIEFHVARILTKFCRTCQHHIKGSTGLLYSKVDVPAHPTTACGEWRYSWTP